MPTTTRTRRRHHHQHPPSALPRQAWLGLVIALGLSGAGGTAWAQVGDTLRPISVHTAGTGDVAGMKKFIELSTLACRGQKGLPLDAPIHYPSDDTLAKLRLQEREEFFEGPPTTPSTAPSAWWQQTRAAATARCACSTTAPPVRARCAAASTAVAAPCSANLIDASAPQAPEVRHSVQRDSQAGCGRPAKAHDIEGLPRAEAGQGVRCVWQLDIVAKSMRAVGLNAPGHSDATAMDTCLYERQPAYFHNGKRTPVIVRISGRPELDAFNAVHGETSALLGQQVVTLGDGTLIPAHRFSPEAVRAYASQPAITGFGD